MGTLGTSRIRYQIKRERVSDLAESTKQKLKKKFERAQEQLKRKFAEAVVPGQSEEFISDILNDKMEESSTEKEAPEELIRMSKFYQESDAISSLIILSLVDHDKYSKQLLIKTDTSLNTGIKLPQTGPKTRVRMDIGKAEHFLDFLFSSGILQDVAYGTTKVKFQSGEEQCIAHAVITSKFSHTVVFYKQYWDSAKYSPLSDSSLWRILHGINPSQQKCLAGLDDVTAAAMTGFETLKNPSGFFKRTDLEDALEKSKQYLKTQYQLNCNDTTPISLHNIAFALSDPSDESLQMPSQVDPGEVCKDCNNLLMAIEEVWNTVDNHSRDQDLKYDIKIATEAIFKYINHLMHDVQQKKSQRMCFFKNIRNSGILAERFQSKSIANKVQRGSKGILWQKRN